jgi:hypothetical protein|tara:strand:- start:301 stop:606 length:306 start_codon:yes stop_codon:yes gene_type:complete
MNRKKSKRIERHAEGLLITWLKGLLTEEEAEGVNMGNYRSLMPEQTHYMAQRTIYLNAYHPKWIKRKIKQLIKIFPNIQIEDVNLEMITWKVNQRSLAQSQ